MKLIVAILLLTALTCSAQYRTDLYAQGIRGIAPSLATVLPQANNVALWVTWNTAATNQIDRARTNVTWSLIDVENKCTWNDQAWTIINTNTSQLHYWVNNVTNQANDLRAFNQRECTIAVWIKPRKFVSAGAFLSTHVISTEESSIMQGGTGNSQLVARVSSSGNRTFTINSPSNTWQLVGLIHRTTGDWVAWRDLTSSATQNTANYGLTVNDYWRIGNRDADASQSFDGSVGPVVVWTNALSGTEWTNYYNIGRHHP